MLKMKLLSAIKVETINVDFNTNRLSITATVHPLNYTRFKGSPELYFVLPLSPSAFDSLKRIIEDSVSAQLGEMEKPDELPF